MSDTCSLFPLFGDPWPSYLLPSHTCTTSSLSLCQSMDIYFHVLAVVNSASVNTGVNVSFQIMLFSGYMPRNGIVGSYGNSIFSFLRNPMLFSVVTLPIYIPTSSVERFPSLHTLSSIYCLWIF